MQMVLLLKVLQTFLFQMLQEQKTFDIKIKAVDLVTVTGKVTGLSEEALNKVQLSFVNTDKIYIPEYQITGDDITINLEKGVEYKIVADGINDYALKGYVNN